MSFFRAEYEGGDGLRRWAEDAIEDDYVTTRFMVFLGITLLLVGSGMGIAALIEARS